jgi:biopolymer transport protein ExbD
MVNQGIIKNSAFHSAIGESSVLAGKGEKHQRSIVAELLLTALIDAFSILVIFLLVSFSATGEILYMGKGMELPTAQAGEQLDRNPVVKVDDGRIYLEEKEVKPDDLTAALLDIRAKHQELHPGGEFPGIITIQGDRRLKYELLNGIVLASSQAGFSDIKFAVIMK